MKRRNPIALAMSTRHTRSGKMRDRRDRRPKDAKKSWRREEF